MLKISYICSMDNTPWTYKSKPFKIKNLDQFWGFVYKITDSKTGYFYVGSKQLKFTSNKIMSKKKKKAFFEESGLRRKRIKEVVESDWKTYKSSSKKVKAMIIENPENFKYEICELYKDKQTMLLYEAYYIINHFIMKNPLILNDWVSIRCNKLK